MRLILFIIIIFAIYWMCHTDKDPATDPDMVLSDPVAEAHRQEIIKNAQEHRMEGYPLYTDEESHIVLQREYERVNDTPDWIIYVVLASLGLCFWAIFSPNQFNVLGAIICFLILAITGNYQYIVLVVIIDVILIPLLIVAGIKGLFSK